MKNSASFDTKIASMFGHFLMFNSYTIRPYQFFLRSSPEKLDTVGRGGGGGGGGGGEYESH